jgi:hypothetical protein
MIHVAVIHHALTWLSLIGIAVGLFHLSAFTSSIANDGNLHQLDFVPDSILPASNLGLLSSTLANLMAIGFVGTSIVRGQMQAPSIRDYGNLDVQPPNVGTLWGSPPRLDDLSRKPIPLAVSEEWDLFAAQDNADDSEDAYGFLWSSDASPIPVPPKKIVQIHWSATITLVENTWSLIQMTLAQPLYPGTYAIVGGRCLSAGALAFRFVPTGNPQAQAWRPGGIGVQSENQLDWGMQRKGGWGTWMYFTNTTVPQIEILSISDDTSEEGIIDIVPL